MGQKFGRNFSDGFLFLKSAVSCQQILLILAFIKKCVNPFFNAKKCKELKKYILLKHWKVSDMLLPIQRSLIGPRPNLTFTTTQYRPILG